MWFLLYLSVNRFDKNIFLVVIETTLNKQLKIWFQLFKDVYCQAIYQQPQLSNFVIKFRNVWLKRERTGITSLRGSRGPHIYLDPSPTLYRTAHARLDPPMIGDTVNIGNKKVLAA